MSLGDILGDIGNAAKDVGNFFSPASLYNSIAGAITGKNPDLQNNPAPSFQDRLGSAVGNDATLKDVNDAIGFASDHFAPLKFAIQLPNQVMDSFFNGVQDAGLDNGSFAKGWSNAWSNYGQAGHVSAGDILGSEISGIFGGNKGILQADPTTTQGANLLHKDARSTWYGSVAGGVSDVLAGFAAPIMGVSAPLRAARAAGTIETAAEAEKIGALTPESAMLAKGSRLLGDKSPTNLAGRLMDTTGQIIDHSNSRTEAMDFLGSKLANADENTKRVITSVAYQAAKLPTREEGQAMLGNAMLTAMGSDAARAELIKSYPLVANTIAEAMAPPSHLSDVATAQQLILQAHLSGSDYRLPVIMQQVFDTPRKLAVRQALADQLDQATQDAIQAKGLRARLTALKPSQRTLQPDGTFLDNFDTARLKETRANAVSQVQDLQSQLSTAKADLAGTQRWSDAVDKTVAKNGIVNIQGFPYQDVKAYNKALGAAQQRVDNLTTQLQQATADRDLFNSTPLNDPDAMDNWRAQMAGAKRGSADAVAKRNTIEAAYRVNNRQIRADAKAMKAISPTLDATNQWLADVSSLGNEGTGIGQLTVTPTYMDAAKAAMRGYIGKTYLYQTGDDYTPNVFVHLPAFVDKHIANFGTEYSMNAIQTRDMYRGSQELRMALRRSGVYSGDEIKAASDRFLAANPADVQKVVSELHDQMTERIAGQMGITGPTARKIINMNATAIGGVRTHLSERLGEAERDGRPLVQVNEFPTDDSSNAIHMVPTGIVRSHLADTVPFLDPYHIKMMLQEQMNNGVNWHNFVNAADHALYATNYVWKVAALMRPGLFVRNMLDTGIRSMALMGTTGAMMSAVNGVGHLIRNDGVKVADWAMRDGTTRANVLQRLGLHAPDGVIARVLGDKGVDIDLGNGETANTSLFERGDRGVLPESIAATRMAAQRGAFMHDSLFSRQQGLTSRVRKQMSVWDRYEPDDPRWPEAFASHLGVMMASPTVREILKTVREPAPENPLTVDDFVNRLFKNPAVRDEYNTFALKANASKKQWIEQLQYEIDTMFPDNSLIGDVLDGKVRGAAGSRWIEQNYPPELRFRVPGPGSVLESKNTLKTLFENVTNRAFGILMDNPDYWMVRHPVAVHVFADQVKKEASQLIEARRAKFGDDAEITPDDVRKITNRARTQAITTVRNYGFDTTHSTVFSHNIHRIAPFYNVYHDVMRAYSKLIYDDPDRLGTLTGMFNAPVNVSDWLPQPLVVDSNGNPLQPGQEPADGRKMVVLNSLIGGKTPFGGVTQRLNLNTFNAILMGDVPWLPGWGPTLQVPVTVALNSAPQVALHLANSNNVFVSTLMKSFFPGGNVPKGGWEDVAKSFAPPVWRHIFDGYDGATFWKNVEYGLNQQYIDAMNKGEKFDFNAALDKAKSDANMANTLLLVAQGVFGLSGDTQGPGHFYVNQMHQLQALGPKLLQQKFGTPSVQAAFSQMFPEAAHLNWSFSQNDTGINATFQAQDSAFKYRKLIDQQPDLGWFILGPDNVGGQFSMTAYNQQQTTGYGLTNAGRSEMDPAQAMAKTQAAFGWDQYLRYVAAANALATQNGYSPKQLAAMKAIEVQRLAKQNPTWFADYNTQLNKIADFYNEADMLAQNPVLNKRQDIQMYIQYRMAQQAVLQQVGLQNYNGSGEKSALVRHILTNIGTVMATKDLGFEQMWERILSRDVKPRPSDSRFNFDS